MITFYKIGNALYKNTFDKNGGMFEAHIINCELEQIETNKKVLVILNGKFCGEREKEYVFNLLLNPFDIKIFIVTDIIALNNNREVLDKCDYILHQCPGNDLLKNCNAKQLYSYVPELFYKYTKMPSNLKNNKMIFGGGLRDNEKVILNYLKRIPSTAYIKTNSTDTRIPYQNYLIELSKHKFALMISRKEYNKIGFVTPRYCEAIANNVIPICDKRFDITNHFAKLRISSITDLKVLYYSLNNASEFCKDFLILENKLLTSKQNNFKKLINNIIGGKYGD